MTRTQFALKNLGLAAAALIVPAMMLGGSNLASAQTATDTSSASSAVPSSSGEASASSDASAPASSSAAPAQTKGQILLADPLLAGADPVHGKMLYQKVGICVSCHGWDGNGMGKNPRSEGNAAMLRDIDLDADTFLHVVACGVPGTPMPYHYSQAYKDDFCYGQKLTDFDQTNAPRKGKQMSLNDVKDVVSYILSAMNGKGKTTYADCVAYFEASADKACAALKAKEDKAAGK